MITHVAISFTGRAGELVCSMAKPARHADIQEALADQFSGGRNRRSLMQQEEGFLDDKGNFLSRARAYQYAIAHSQKIKGAVIGGQLHSENLW